MFIFNKQKYVNCNIQNIFNVKLSFDNKEYICKTCHSKVIKGKVPCQAVYNDMFVDDMPTELSTLEKLEQILIAQRIVFEKIVVMPKGQQRKIKGSICNVPVERDKTCQTLPRAPESSRIILLKLKRKLQFRGHVYYQAVCPEIVLSALNLRPWQTRTRCRHKCFSVCPSCGPQKICVRDTKMFDFVQKHFVSATNVSQFAQSISHLCTQRKTTNCNKQFFIQYLDKYLHQCSSLYLI